MVDVNVLSVLLYTFGIILLIVLIILGIKLIYLVDKADKVLDKSNKLVDNLTEKVNSFNPVFNVFEKFNASLFKISDSVIYSIINMISRIFGNKKEKRKEDDFDE